MSQVSCRDLKSTFFDHPTRVQEVEFAKYNLEQQYRLLLCGYQAMHPAELVPASEMARNAEKTGAFLADKLAKTRSDLTVLNIVFVFRLMQSMNTFEISSNNDLASLVRRRVDAIKDPDWQREATEMMREMGL